MELLRYGQIAAWLPASWEPADGQRPGVAEDPVEASVQTRLGLTHMGLCAQRASGPTR